MRSIARVEAEYAASAAVLKSRQQCIEGGPVSTIWSEIGKMRDVMVEMQKAWAQERGEANGIMKAHAKQTAILVAAITLAGVVAQIALGLIRHTG